MIVFSPSCDFTKGKLLTYNSMSLATVVFKGMSLRYVLSSELLSHTDICDIPFLVFSPQDKVKQKCFIFG